MGWQKNMHMDDETWARCEAQQAEQEDAKAKAAEKKAAFLQWCRDARRKRQAAAEAAARATRKKTERLRSARSATAIIVGAAPAPLAKAACAAVFDAHLARIIEELDEAERGNAKRAKAKRPNRQAKVRAGRFDADDDLSGLGAERRALSGRRFCGVCFRAGICVGGLRCGCPRDSRNRCSRGRGGLCYSSRRDDCSH